MGMYIGTKRSVFGSAGASAKAAGSPSYKTKVLGYSPIAYWALDEAGGAGAAVCSIDSNQNGTPANVTFGDTTGPDGVLTAPLFNGTNSLIDIQTATLAGVFDGTEGAVSIWFKVYNVGVHSDATNREVLLLYVDANNGLFMRKSSTAGRFNWSYEAAGTAVAAGKTSWTPTAWTHVGMRWSDSGNLVEYFVDGVESTQDAMNTTWAGALTDSVISNSQNGSYWWHGWLAHMAIFDTAIDDATFLGLGTV